MSFYKWVLEEIGASTLSFTPPATTWTSVGGFWSAAIASATALPRRLASSPAFGAAYWRQQVGYGISEALLERKHPNKFNPWGHTFWAAASTRLIRFSACSPNRSFIRAVGLGGFQRLYDKAGRAP